MDCLICFYPIQQGDSITCGNPECSASICSECAKSYILFSKTENQIAKCPSSSCRNEYLYSNIKKLGKEYEILYNDTCFQYFNMENTNDVDNIVNHDLLLDKIRKERKEFIQLQFPVAISLTIEHALSSKMRKIDKQNRLKIKKIINDSNRKCINLLCPGKLNADFKCLTCDTIFCKQCEKKTHIGHICKDEDIQSLQFIKSLVKCPKCLYPVIRSYGCNNMTCSVCKTDFNYITGQISVVGGNHDNAHTEINTSIKPSERFKNDYNIDVLKLLIEFENKTPKEESLTYILKQLIKIKKGETELCDNIKESIAKSYEKHQTSVYRQKRYYKLAQIIEECHNNNELTTSVIENLIKMASEL